MPASPRKGRPGTTPPISAIVLAAGRSTRMGRSKPLVRLGGRPILEYVLEALAATRISDVVVVLGHDAARVRGEIAMGPARVVINPDYRQGMSTSLRAGLRAADPSAEGYLFVLGDQPFVASATVDALVDAWMRRRARILIPAFRGRRGNPVLADRVLAPEMESVTGDVGFRALFAKHVTEILEVAVDDPGVLFDVDTAEQVESLETRLANGIPLHEALTELVSADATREA